MKLTFTLIFIAASANLVFGQFKSFGEMTYMGWSSPTGKDHDESYVFEARPILSLPVYGNLFDAIKKGEKRVIPVFSLVFDPQIRMYSKPSVPVVMPTYRLFGSLELISQLGRRNSLKQIVNPWAIASLTIEHGHYSNGQSGCVFGSSQDNDSICQILTANAESIDVRQHLNRESGEFSTNFIQIKPKFMYFLGGFESGSGRMNDAVEVTLGYTRLVDRVLAFDFGGYDDNYAPKFYPMNQYYTEVAYKYNTRDPVKSERHLRIGADYSYRPSRNSTVFPHNIGLTGAYFWNSGIGVMLKLEYGQDMYNVRFVDKISRVFVGLAWNMESPSRLAWPAAF